MNWVLLALLAPAVYTIVNFIDKYLVSDAVKDYRAMPIYATIVGLIGGTIIWLISGFPTLDPRSATIVLFTGMLTIWGVPLYFKVMSKEETTTVIILVQTIPVMTLLLSYLLLGETITIKQFIGFMIILTSAALASINSSKGKLFSLSSSFFLALIYCFMWALAGVLIKFAFEANTFSVILSYESWGIGLGGIILFILFPSIRNAFLKNIRKVKKPTLGFIFANEIVFVLAKGITFLAYSLGPVALVSVLGGTQVFFGLIYGFALTTLFPKLFKEDISRKTLIKKGALACLVVIGIILIS